MDIVLEVMKAAGLTRSVFITRACNHLWSHESDVNSLSVHLQGGPLYNISISRDCYFIYLKINAFLFRKGFVAGLFSVYFVVMGCDGKGSKRKLQDHSVQVKAEEL